MDKNILIEIIGIIASVIIVFSMIFKTSTYKGTITMRVINTIGSIGFIIYGALLPAWATLITNSSLFIINIFYLIKEYKDNKNKLKKPSSD